MFFQKFLKMLYFLFANIFANNLWISWLQLFQKCPDFGGSFPPLSLLRAREYFPGHFSCEEKMGMQIKRRKNSSAKFISINMHRCLATM